MAKKEQVQYVCTSCGNSFSTWSGKCYSCGEWNTLEEKIAIAAVGQIISQGKNIKTATLKDSLLQDKPRISSGIKEFDEVVGGGVVLGSINLVAGQPGIGKSTILLQIAHNVSGDNKVLYVSGEESMHQVAMRAKRLGINNSSIDMASSTSADDVANTIANSSYDMVIVDSIQTLACQAVSSSAGSVSQITNSTQLLTVAAKQTNTALIIVGHVTKEGSIAGPKVLEHVVDVVLQLEGDRYGGFKLLRAIKNRFGTTTESGIFEMSEKGLMPVENPSATLLAERQITDGSIVLATMEGTRPILVEVQALVNRSNFGYPKRTASGTDINRVNLLIAMLEKRTKLNLSDQDIFINIVGGIKLQEPASDLAICMAIASAAKGMQLKKNVVVFGEIGLSGEIRHVPYIEKRVKEAEKLGFDGSVGPAMKKKVKGYTGVSNIKSALNNLLEKE